MSLFSEKIKESKINMQWRVYWHIASHPCMVVVAYKRGTEGWASYQNNTKYHWHTVTISWVHLFIYMSEQNLQIDLKKGRTVLLVWMHWYENLADTDYSLDLKADNNILANKSKFKEK